MWHRCKLSHREIYHCNPHNIATGKSTRSPTNKLICRHEIPNFQPVATNGSLRIKIRLNFLNFERSLLSPSQLTRLTLWNRARRCRGKLGFLWWVDDTATCKVDPRRFNFASLLVDVASQFQVSNAKGVTLSGASTSSHFSDRQHMGRWKQNPVSSTMLTNFGRLTRWQSSQALHKAQSHEEQTGTWRQAPSWPSWTRKNCARRASL